MIKVYKPAHIIPQSCTECSMQQHYATECQIGRDAAHMDNYT